MVILSGCAKTACSYTALYNLPEMPIAGVKVADELAQVCNNEKCPNTNKWLNDLYLFKQQYTLYRHALNNRDT